jgi:ATP-binding cassette subfamily B protein RaxB
MVKFGGIDIRRLGLDTYRQWAGAVMQDDQLFAGSIADNICFFSLEPDMTRILNTARIASIHADIMMMPMAYESLVGDMGSSLSGGQKQRIILARAIYRNPKLLVLDEATSHLDAKCECLVDEAVGRMSLTKLVISHRATVIKAANRELVVFQGKVTLPEPISSTPA